MKRTHFFLLASCAALLTGCTSREAELEQTIQELTERNATLAEESVRYKQQIEALEQDVADYQNQRAKASDTEQELEDYKSLLVRLGSTVNLADESLYENHEVSCTLSFKWSGYGTKLLREPTADSGELCEIQQGDEVDVTNLLIARETEQTYLRAVLKPGLVGFIPMSGNPYRNGTFSYKETLSTDGTNVTILNFTGSYGVSEATLIRSAPSETADSLHKVTHSEGGQYHQVDGITEDYVWVRVTVGEYTGWIPRTALYMDRGGPTVYTPEVFINWELIGSNEI